MNDNATFTNKLRKVIFSGDLSQVELAKKLGVSQQAVSMWVNGKKFPRTAMVQKIADIYEVDFSYFFKEDEDKPRMQVGQNVKVMHGTKGFTFVPLDDPIDKAMELTKRIMNLSQTQRNLLEKIIEEMEGHNG